MAGFRLQPWELSAWLALLHSLRFPPVLSEWVAFPAVRRVNFTGSTRVGREIAVSAAKHLKPCLLELSGKGTAVVLADAAIDLVARSIAHGSFFNPGPLFMSTARVIADTSVAAALVARLAQ